MWNASGNPSAVTHILSGLVSFVCLFVCLFVCANANRISLRLLYILYRVTCLLHSNKFEVLIKLLSVNTASYLYNLCIRGAKTTPATWINIRYKQPCFSERQYFQFVPLISGYFKCKESQITLRHSHNITERLLLALINTLWTKHNIFYL